MIAGIDYSTFFVDVVILYDEEPPQWSRYPLSGQDAFDRTRSIRDICPTRGHWTDEGVVALGIEDPRGYGSGVLSRVQGGILATLPSSLLVKPWDPKSWRVKIGLKGNCTKQDIKEWAVSLHPQFADYEFDACDALGIATATSLALG